MGLLPSAPLVQVHAPAHWYAGELYNVQFEVIAKDEMKVDFIDATLITEEGWQIKSGKQSIGFTWKSFERRVRLREFGVLPAGSSQFSAQFGVPAALPPTHQVEPAWNVCALRVHVSIPWWPDGRYRFPLAVGHRIADQIERTPLVMRSTQIGERADKPRIELGLASSRLIAGEALTGSVALFHVDDDKPREVTLALVPSLALRGRGPDRHRRGDMFCRTIELPAGFAGKAHQFELAIPATITPSFASETHALEWHLLAKIGSFLGPNIALRAPLTIVDLSAARTTPRLLAPPRVADARVTAILAQYARAAGWTESQVDEQPAVERQAGDSELHIAYSYRGEDGTFLVGRVDHPSLGLGLAVKPSSAMRHVFFKDIEIDVAAWDRAHHVVARFPEQTIPFLRAAIGPALGERALGQLVRWDDSAIVFERPIASLEAAEVAALGSALGQVAAAIESARPQIEPPPGIAVDAAAWQELARWLRGTLGLGELAIDGELDRMPVALGLRWDREDRPEGLLVEVGHPDRASAALREVTIRLARPAQQYLEVSRAELAERLARWPEDSVDLQILDGVARAALVGTFDATRVRDLVQALRGLLAALDPEPGPYR